MTPFPNNPICTHSVFFLLPQIIKMVNHQYTIQNRNTKQGDESDTCRDAERQPAYPQGQNTSDQRQRNRREDHKGIDYASECKEKKQQNQKISIEVTKNQRPLKEVIEEVFVRYPELNFKNKRRIMDSMLEIIGEEGSMPEVEIQNRTDKMISAYL